MFARKLIKPFFLIVLVIFILFFSIFERLDSTPYKESKFYKQTMFSLDSLDRLNSNIEGDTLKMGWAKSSLIPSFPTPLAGYGERKGKINIGVEDSIWVRTIVLDNGKNRAAYISLDLLIRPPNLNFNDILKGTNLRDNEIFLTASHSHSSIGGYLPSVVGEMFAGEYDEKILKFISGAIRESLLDALNNMEITKVGYSRIKAEEFITNRLVGDSIGAKDNWIRLVKFERNSGKNIIMFSYSAHATCYTSKQLKVSSDYPGKCIFHLEELPKIDFAMYGAGAVGSMAPKYKILNGKDKLDAISKGISIKIINTIDSFPTFFENRLFSNKIYIKMRKPSFRFNDFLIFKPWIFNYLVGLDNTSKYFSFLKLGDILIIGAPADFSGELVEPLEEFAFSKNMNLIINSFNGGYLGYITKDNWYNKKNINTYETYTMNWYGPYNGSYFSDIIKKIIDINEI